MCRRFALLTVAALLALPGVAASAAGPVLGAADGVEATQSGSTVEIRFTGGSAAAAGIGGKQVRVECRTQPAPGLLFGDGGGTSSTGTSVRASAAGDVVRAPLSSRTAWDVCTVGGPGRSAGDGPVARIAVSPRGVTYLDELAHATQLFDVTDQTLPTGTRYRPAAELVAANDGRVVALDDPAASPPPGTVGYWTDGASRSALVTLSGAGRRLVVEDLSSGMVRSNVSAYLGDYAATHPTVGVDGTFPEDTDKGADRRNGKDVVPVEPGHGITGRRTGARVTLRFGGAGARAFRRIAGRRVDVRCIDRRTTEPRPADRLLPVFSDGVIRVPPRGGILRARVPRGGDLCVVVDDTQLVAVVALTPGGRRFWADVRAAYDVFGSGFSGLAAKGATAYPSPAAAAGRGKRLVALGGPDASPPTGKVGVWTDGARQALLATVSTSGRRLVFADEGDGTIRSNLLDLVAVGGLVLPIAVESSFSIT